MDQQLLENYYRNFFPAELIHSWLAHGRNPKSKDPVVEDDFEKREFSFTLPGDIYCRHKSFDNFAELRQALVEGRPEKIDIGAVWTVAPKNKTKLSNSVPYETVEKEFVIDIDMTDYDNVRTCCQGATVCEKCWKFLVVACKSIDRALRLSFGFEQNLWVFSGRRGIHCWACDSSARRLNDFRRKSLIEFLNSGPRYHTPFIQIFNEVLKVHFDEIIVQDQKLFTNEEHKNTIKEICGSEFPDELLSMGNDKFWEKFVNYVESRSDRSEIMMKIAYKFLYPRLDVHVSTATNHLLKAPFSVHPATKKVCVPFEPSQVHNFNLDAVPDLARTCDGSLEFEKALSIFEDFIKRVREEYQEERKRHAEYNRNNADTKMDYA